MLAASPASPETQSARTRLELGLIAAGFLIYFLALPHGLAGDDVIRFDGLSQLLEGRGVPRIRYSLLGPLLSAPLYVLGKVAFGPAWWLSRYNVIVLAVGVLVLYRLLSGAADRDVLRRFVLIVLAASLFPNAMRSFGPETFAAMCLLCGIALVPRRFIAGSVLLAAATVNTPAMALATGAVCVKQAIDEKRWRYLLVLPLAAGLILVEARWRLGAWFITGYEGDRGFQTLMPYSGLPGFSYPFVLGVLSLIFSSGKGLLFFTPGLFLPMPRTTAPPSSAWRRLHTMGLIVVIGLVVVYAKWWAWYGGESWGPRFLLFASVPAAIAIASRLNRVDDGMPARLATLVALALSSWAAMTGAAFGVTGFDVCARNNYALESLCWYVPEFSPLWHPFLASDGVSIAELLVLTYGLCVFFYLAAPLTRSLIRDALQTVIVAAQRLRHDWRF